MKKLLILLVVLFISFSSFSQDPCVGVVVDQPFTCGQNLVDPRDGKVYPTVYMNFQCWMAKNLEFDTVGAYYYLNNTAYAIYGRLYNWFTAMAGSSDFDGYPGEVRGICPPGWHIPSNEEFFRLDNFYLPMMGLNGGALKSTLTDAGIGSWILPNTDATNSTGFSAIPGGWGLPYQQQGNIAYFWTSTGGGDNAYYYYLESYTSELDRVSVEKITRRSVRCVMDCDFSTLPIVLLHFRASLSEGGEDVVLDWSTASELDSDRFLVERSGDGVSGWVAIDSLPAVGSISGVTDYQLYDNRPLGGENYYRLVEFDVHGTRHVYGVSFLYFKGLGYVFPNPITSGGRVTLPTSHNFRVVSATGGSVGFLRNGDVVNLPSGVYLLLPLNFGSIRPIRLVVN
jgi:uncharacterized protein (TIGR02145 family)